MVIYALVLIGGLALGAALGTLPIAKKMVNDSLTGMDNDTFDIGRISFVAGLATFLGLEVFAVVAKGITFDMQTFGIAFGAMMVAMGGMLALKSKTEPSGGTNEKIPVASDDKK